jgi:flagellar hook-length control protein FliK
MLPLTSALTSLPALPSPRFASMPAPAGPGAKDGGVESPQAAFPGQIERLNPKAPADPGPEARKLGPTPLAEEAPPAEAKPEPPTSAPMPAPTTLQRAALWRKMPAPADTLKADAAEAAKALAAASSSTKPAPGGALATQPIFSNLPAALEPTRREPLDGPGPGPEVKAEEMADDKTVNDAAPTPEAAKLGPLPLADEIPPPRLALPATPPADAPAATERPPKLPPIEAPPESEEAGPPLGPPVFANLPAPAGPELTRPPLARPIPRAVEPAKAAPAGDSGPVPGATGVAGVTSPATAGTEPKATAASAPAADPAAANFATVLASATTTAARSSAEPTTAPAQATLAADPRSPEFAPQLGTQLTLWARDGVQRASLELNPLELGPVSVRIQLDGGNAQVLLAAEHAATRSALEQALPTLASSLRDAGLVLSGGGVFDPRQSAGQNGASGQARGEGRDDRAATRRSLEALAATAGPDGARAGLPLQRARGVIDLFV